MLSYYCYRTTGNPVKLPYNVLLEQYMIRRMFYWGHNQVRTFRHPALERHYRALLRPEVTPANKVVHFTTRFSIFYFGPVLISVLLMLPWVWRDRKFRPLLACLAVVVFGVSFVEWIHIHYIAPITAVFIALTVQCLRHVRTLRLQGYRFGRAAVIVLVTANLIVTVNHARYFWFNRLHGWWVTRQNIVDRFAATGQKHLMIVRYADTHPPVWEWIWNAADIDGSSVVWAREMADMRPLLNYFHDRKVWLVEPDKYPIEPRPYVR
jgi:hypothetical protein